METNLDNPAIDPTHDSVKPRLNWLQEQREAIRKRGNIPIEFTPIKIKGEPLSMTVIRERRGDFDDDPIS